MLKSTIPFLTLALFFASCAKEKETEKVHIDNPNLLFSKVEVNKLCDPNEPLLYVPSVGAVPRAVSSARPYELGDAKVVTCTIKEDKIVFNELESDERFTDNENNKSPVLELSIEHIDFKCAEDSYGDCTNTEEEDIEKNWTLRRSLKVDDQSVNILAKDINLSLDRSNLLSGCFSEVGKEIHDFKLSNKSLNFTIKRHMNVGLNCASFIQSAEDIRYSEFYTDYKFSLVKLSDIADKDYEVINYPKYDQSKFGFFTTEKVKMTTDNLTSVTGIRTYLLNRWSPNKEEIVYYLSEDFYSEGMDVVRQATVEGIESVNKSLVEANAKIKITLKDGRGHSTGDITKNFLVLVKDPHSSGVIGYGPSVKNPFTGEIVSARTIMYYGTIRKTIASAYDKLLTQNPLSLGSSDDIAPGHTAQVEDGDLLVNHSEISHYQEFNDIVESFDPFNFIANNNSEQEELSLEDSTHKIHSHASELEEEIKYLSERTFYHESMTNMAPIIDSLGIKVTKPWSELTEKERDTIITQMLPYLWIPTLVHEFGHNLGLRHNFHGSVDKDNFYTEDEIVDLKLKRIPEYSSIMDYAYNSHTELSVMGKYDIAALRFGYAREVKTKSGDVVKLDSGLSTQNVDLHTFKYCTDENVANDTLCNRHDEGTSLVELATHYVDKYDEYYKFRNIRGRKFNFDSISGDLSYAQYVLGTFSNMRQIVSQFALYEKYGMGNRTDPAIKEKYADAKAASAIIFKFFLKVVKTAPKTCAVFNEKEPNTLLTLIPIDSSYSSKGICGDYESYLNGPNSPFPTDAGQVYRLQNAGHFINNATDYKRTEEVSTRISQIDVRGIALDKIFAVNMLTARDSSVTGGFASFLDIPEYKAEIVSLVSELIDNKLDTAVSFLDLEGKVKEEKYVYNIVNTHSLSMSYNYVINGFLGLNYEKNDIRSPMLKFIKGNLKSPKSEVELENHMELYDAMSVKQVSKRGDLSRSDFDKIVSFKNSTGKTIYRFGVYDYNTFGMGLATKKEVLDIIEGLDAEKRELLTAVFRGAVKPEDVKDEAIISIITTQEYINPTVEFLQGFLTNETLIKSFKALAN